MGLYKGEGNASWAAEIDAIQAQLGREGVVMDSFGQALSHLAVSTAVTFIDLPIWTAPAPENKAREVLLTSGSEHAANSGAYWTFRPYLRDSNGKDRPLAAELSTASEKLQEKVPYTWTVDRDIKSGEIVFMRISWSGSPSDLYGLSFEVKTERGAI